MNKADLIIKFSKKIGIPDANAKLFLELLLKRISASLRPSQSIFIPEFGYFHFIKGKFKKPALGISNDEISEELIDLLLYTEDKKLSQSETKGFVFSIPYSHEDDYNPIDSYFSLSIGKPLIPLRGVSSESIYIPTSGYEYKKLLESKVEKIITQSEIITSEELFPTLIVDASSYNTNQVQLEKSEERLDEILSDDQNSSDQSAEVSEENIVRNIAWDFGENFSQKISADSILDLADERINNPNKPEQKPHFEIQDVTEPESEKESQNEQDILDELLEHENESDIIAAADENFFNKEGDEKTNLSKSGIDEAEKLLDDLSNFEEVKSELSESKPRDEELSDEEFWKSTSKLFETYDPRELGQDQSDEFTEVKSTTLNLGDHPSKASKIKLASETQTNEINLDEDETNDIDEQSTSREEKIETDRKNIKWAFLVFSLLLILAAAWFYWFTQIHKKSSDVVSKHDLTLKTNNTNIIERDFNIPITYPYLPLNVTNEKVNTDTSMIRDTVAIISVEKNPELKNQEKQNAPDKKLVTEKNKIHTGKPISVGNNIYRYGDMYIVQVASFRSSSISENEAGKYRDKGFNAFVEATEITGKGLWYRVKVGNFSSVTEAKDFIAKNIR